MKNLRSIQVVNHQRQHLYESLQEAVLSETGVNCRIHVREKEISIRTKDWTDYYLSRAVVSKRTGKKVVRDQTVLGESAQ